MILILTYNLSTQINNNIKQSNFTKISNAHNQLKHSLKLQKKQTHPNPHHHQCTTQAKSKHNLPTKNHNQSSKTQEQHHHQPIQTTQQHAQQLPHDQTRTKRNLP